jgi:signal transduction histidine kinase
VAEGRPALGVHGSVFAKLVAIMLVMAASLLAMVSCFFFLIVHPRLGAAVDRLFLDHTRTLAAAAPDRAAAQKLAARLGLHVRYEGPRGAWSTAPGLPAIEEVRRRDARSLARPAWGRGQYLVEAGDGGTYLFAWDFLGEMKMAHDRLLLLLLVLMAGVVFTAHAVLRRALHPLRALHGGVARLSEGDLEVAVDVRTRDEFGLLTDAFNQMARRVRDMVRSRDQLLLDVSHELRSPLTRMKVALALLPPGEKAEQMGKDVAEMEAMIASLLERERLRDGGALRRVPLDLAPLLHETARSFGDAPPGLRVEAPPALPVTADAEQVRVVLRNVLDNALKFSLPDSRPVEVRAARDGQAVVVRVSDDGPGIPPGDLARLFEPFFRVDRSRSRSTGGYGLGLSICKRIMEAHGGGIAAVGGPGRGATFVLRFPLQG